MNAEQARALAEKAREVDESKVRVVLELWHNAITKAANSGRFSVRDTELQVPRTPIPKSARVAALTELEKQGFRVQTVQAGPDEYEVEVSWL